MTRAAIAGVACGALLRLAPTEIAQWLVFLVTLVGVAIVPFFALAPRRRATVGRLALFLACMAVALTWLDAFDRELADRWWALLVSPISVIPLLATALISRESSRARWFALFLSAGILALNLVAVAMIWNVRRMVIPEIRDELTASAILVSVKAIVTIPAAFVCWRLRRG